MNDLTIYFQAALSFGFLIGLVRATQMFSPRFVMTRLNMLQGVIWMFLILFLPPLVMSLGLAPFKALLSSFTMLWLFSLPFYALGLFFPIVIFWLWRKMRGEQKSD